MSAWKAPFVTPAALADLERLWCHTETPAIQIRTILRERHGIDIDPVEHANRRGFMRPRSRNQTAVNDRAQVASLTRWQAPGRPPDNPVRKSATRDPTPPGGFRIGAR